jgi:hypothetical protein
MITTPLTSQILSEAFNIFNHASCNGHNSTLYASVATTATTPLNQPVQLVRQSNFGIPNNDGSQPEGTNACSLQFSLQHKFYPVTWKNAAPSMAAFRARAACRAARRQGCRQRKQHGRSSGRLRSWFK